MLKRYFILLSYKGTNYHGWQLQKNAVTVQSVVNEGLSLILKAEITVTGCGRTDTGVHAKEYYAHFDFEKNLTKPVREELVKKLNRFFPKDIVIHSVFPVKTNAHARFSAISRTYTYIISTQKNAFTNEYSYHIPHKLDISLMNKASNLLLDYTDFTSFSKLHSQTATNNCQIKHASWEKQNGQLIFTIQADRFLRNMVRAIVGTLLDVGLKKISLQDFRKIILDKNRSSAGQSVPACGLFLEKIEYPVDLFQ